MTPEEAAAVILYEAEGPDGFLARLERDHVFDAERWHYLWVAVSHLVSYNKGVFDVWTSYDLSRVIRTIQAYGQELVGRSYDSLDRFEMQILEANLFVAQVLAEQ